MDCINEITSSISTDHCDDTATVDNQSPSQVSKNQLRRLRREQRWIDIKAKIAFEKEAKRKKEMDSGEPINNLHRPMGDSEAHSRRIAKRQEGRKEFADLCDQGPTLIIDCEFEDRLSRSEMKSLSQQCCYSYALNRACTKPFKMMLSGVKQDSFIRSHLKKVAGTADWQWAISDEEYKDIVPMDKVVYLSSDSDIILEKMDPSEVYIIGGIVDRNRLKNATKTKASEQGVRTAALPINADTVELDGSKVLTVNQVVNILTAFQDCGDWTKAIHLAIPRRKLKLSAEEKAKDEENNRLKQEERIRKLQARNCGPHSEVVQETAE